MFCCGKKKSEETPAKDRFPSSFHDVKTAVDGGQYNRFYRYNSVYCPLQVCRRQTCIKYRVEQLAAHKIRFLQRNTFRALDRQKPKNSYGFLGRRTVKIIFIDLTISPSAAILPGGKIAENVFCCGKEREETPATDHFPSSFHDVKTAVDGKPVESVNPSFYRRPLSSLYIKP